MKRHFEFHMLMHAPIVCVFFHFNNLFMLNLELEKHLMHRICFLVEQVMSMITTLCLRSPENAACAIESGAGDLAIQTMNKFPLSDQLQRSSCFMIRNLVVRNAENR